MSLVRLSDGISYLPATDRPFCCDIVLVQDGGVTWVFDVGIGKAAARCVNGIEGEKNVVLSHFHPDHIANLPFVSYDRLFVSRNTRRYTRTGTVVEERMDSGGVSIVPMPSSHAKGCLALLCGEYAFLGDGAFCMTRGVHHYYNVQLLGSMLSFLRGTPSRYFCLDHEKNFVQERETVLSLYEGIYARRDPGSPLICVDDYFE